MAKRILAVDDSATMRQTVELTLARAGYEVVTACDGQDGLVKIGENGQFDAILTDVNMPNMDGITFTAEVRKLANYAGTPIIIVTTESQGDKKSAGKAAGATGWIVKPFQPEQLVGILQKVCP